MRSVKIFFMIVIINIVNSNSSFSNIQSNNSQTKIKSDIIKIKRKSNKIDFLKNARIENDDTSILADKITFFYLENNKNERSIKDIKANGNVKIFSDEFSATGKKGSYDPRESAFVMTENVVFNNGVSIAKGEKFIYKLDTKRGFLVGNKENNVKLNDDRVMLIINNND